MKKYNKLLCFGEWKMKKRGSYKYLNQSPYEDLIKFNQITKEMEIDKIEDKIINNRKYTICFGWWRW